jgi:hypothetical protein
MSLSPTDAHADDHRRYGNTDPAEDPDGVVFVDSTGRRALLLRRAAIVFGAAVLVYAGMLGVAFMGGPSLAPSELAPFDSVGNAQDPGNSGVRPAGSPSAGPQAAKPCRKHCGRKCRKQPGKPCRRKPFKKAFNGPNGPAPTPSAASSATSSVEGSSDR